MASGLAGYDLESDLGPKAWGFVFFVCFLGLLWACRRVSACCLTSQRAKLRDEYEDELRRGGKLTNRLLLPVANRVDWNPYRGPPFAGR